MPAARRTPVSSSEQPGGPKRQCLHCDRTFTRTEHLERHIRAHTREKPFRCQDCGKCYSRRDTLLRHQRNHGTNDSQAEEFEVPQDNMNVSNGQSASDPVQQGRALGAHVGPLANTPSSFSSDQMHSGSRSDEHLSNSSTRDHSESTSQMISILSMDDVVSSIPAQLSEPPLDHGMSDAIEPADFNFDYDWQNFPSYMFSSTSDIENMFSPYTLDLIQPSWAPPSKPEEQSDSANDQSRELKRLWFTHIRPSEESHPVSGTATPSEPRQEVDENYRQTMRKSLHIRTVDTSLPSPDFINLCIRLYFIRFHPKFPVIHMPTFKPSKTNSMLLLSICSIGSLMTGTANGINQGVHIWEILNRAILAKWERLLARATDDKFTVVQAALLGQTFALLSGDPKHLAAAETWHGSLISSARRFKVFQLSHKELPQPNSFTTDLDAEWRKWARNEELIRMSLGLYLHDAELAYIFHHEPLLRPSRRISCAASDELFGAKQPKEWLSKLQRRVEVDNLGSFEASIVHNMPRTEAYHPDLASTFTKYVRLECISATILEERLSGRLNDAAQQALAEELVSFHEQCLQFPTTQDISTVELEILWHFSFIALCTDFDLLERVLGRDGSRIAEMDQEKIRTWATSQDARRAVIHVRMVRQRLESLPIGLVPAVHIPRAIFFVAVCCYCAFTFNTASENHYSIGNELPESGVIGLEANSLAAGKLAALETKEMLCHLSDMLQRLGYWEIARKFGAIIEALLRRLLV